MRVHRCLGAGWLLAVLGVFHSICAEPARLTNVSCDVGELSFSDSAIVFETEGRKWKFTFGEGPGYPFLSVQGLEAKSLLPKPNGYPDPAELERIEFRGENGSDSFGISKNENIGIVRILISVEYEQEIVVWKLIKPRS